MKLYSESGLDNGGRKNYFLFPNQSIINDSLGNAMSTAKKEP